MNTQEEQIREFEDKALNAYCKQSEVEGFLFKEYDGFISQDESNGYCIGFQNGYKQALIDINHGKEENT